MLYACCLLLLLAGGCSNEPTQPHQPEAPAAPAPRFTLLSPAATGVDFQNTLTEGPNTNILVYEYFYNGGGVATGDFDGDRRADLYFTANMEANRLYLNEGGLRFRDVTAASGTAGRPGPWKTGVTAVDINGDRRLDLYVSYSGMLPDPKRCNQLFINLGNDAAGVPQFEDQAEAYGLASEAYSNQAYFFDYDRDGDLDMLLLNHNPKSLPVLNEASTAALMQQDDPLRGLRLYRQDGGRFSDVTQAAGIVGAPLAYGLGLGIGDVNRDGWPDFYVSNDYTAPDYLYINRRNGTFADELPAQIGHNSHFSMGNDLADVDNDGLTDIFTLDMLPEDNRRQKLLLSPDNYAKFDLNVRSGFHYQYMRNMLQLNNGDGTFSETGQLAGLSNTDWSWSALWADLDNDGWKDLHITNGYNRDYTNLDFIKYMDTFVQAKGRLVREDVLDLISHMPASGVSNYCFAHTGGATWTDVTQAWGLYRPSNSNGAVYADLDDDGDLDLVVNNINQPAFVYRNESQERQPQHYLQVTLEGAGLNTPGIGARLEVRTAGRLQVLEQAPARGYLSSVTPVLHVGLGAATQVDTLRIVWPGGQEQVRYQVPADQRIALREADATLPAATAPRPAPTLFRTRPTPVSHRQARLDVNDFYRQSLLINELSYVGPVMALGDADGDGRDDLCIGGVAGQPAALYMQQAGMRFVPRTVPAFAEARAHEDAAVLWLDADADGDADLYIASGGYHDFGQDDARLQDRFYRNDGRGNFVYDPDALPAMPTSTGAAVVVDVNQDGHPDLFVGGRVVPGRYPETPASYLLVNDGQGRWTDRTDALAPDLRRIGMVTAAVWADLDQDSLPELLVAGEWMALRVFAVQGGRLVDATRRYFDQDYSGWWSALRVADVNGDGRPDVVAGNVGTNTQFRMSAETPVSLYFGDFDANGSVDPIFCTYIQGRRYPYVTRDELLGQLSGLRARFNSYESYADVVLEDIFDAQTLQHAGHLEARHPHTSLFLNQGAAPMAPQALPVQAQYAPVYAIEVLDADGDARVDLLLCGNQYHAKLRLGRADANHGVLLLGDGQGAFRYVPQTRSGLRIRGEVRSIVRLGTTFLFGINQGDIVACQLESAGL
ncbi:MAG: VCBS repeat-containing protein [Bacteroidia bacterium]